MENSQKHGMLWAPASYDLAMLEEMDDAEYLLEVLDLLLQETPKEIKQLQEALRAGNADTVYKKAHKLKSSFGVIQAESLVVLLEDIEALSKKGILNDELKSLVEHTTAAYRDIEKSLKEYVEELR